MYWTPPTDDTPPVFLVVDVKTLKRITGGNLSPPNLKNAIVDKLL
jgi:hypothetical protein